jgi:hypothetical protein
MINFITISKELGHHRSLDIREVGSGAQEESASLQTQIPEYNRGGIRCLGGIRIPTNTDP